MKRALFLMIGLSLSIFMSGQTFPFVSINQINQPVNLANCNDTSLYYGDTVRTVGVVVTDGGLSEVPSGSVTGGYRPFIFLVDTADNGQPGHYKGLEMMAIYQNAQGSFQPLSLASQLLAGDIVEISGYIGAYESSNQITTLNANSINIIGSQSAPVDTVLPLAYFNDANRVNQVTTGEPWEGAYVTFENVTVTDVIPFSNGRVSFNVADAMGNTINVSDRFLAQKTSSHQVVNPNSPAGANGTGSFVPPVPGTFYNSISGVIRQSGNGCTGGTGRGYEINPFDSSHYNIGFAPPYVEKVERDPLVPNANQVADITATITDFDGSVDSVAIFWSSDTSVAPSNFTAHKMNLAIGSTEEFEYTIPAHPNGTIVRYYIMAIDNEGNVSYYPNKPVAQTEPNYDFYTVRPDGLTISDLQFSLTGSGESPYRGKQVTVKGVVTASTKPYDLGYVYIQDTTTGNYNGISLIGAFDLNNVFRSEWIEVSGEVQENYGFTQIAVSQVTRLNKYDTIQAVSLNPSDSAGYVSGEWEKYEGMLVKFENPAGGKIYITDNNVGFGDYTVGTDPSFGMNKSARILAGRQSGSAASSLWVQLVTDTIYETVDGTMFLPAITTSDTMTMDAVVGVLSYGFFNYRLLPRANDDIIGLNAPLNMTINRPGAVGIEEISSTSNIEVYPNPTDDVVHIKSEEKGFTVLIYDLNGRKILSSSAGMQNEVSISAASLANGIYLMQVKSAGNELLGTHKIIIRK